MLEEGLRLASARNVTGKDVTPFLLDHFHRATHGASLIVNERIIVRNAELAARIAVVDARRDEGDREHHRVDGDARAERIRECAIIGQYVSDFRIFAGAPDDGAFSARRGLSVHERRFFSFAFPDRRG